MLWAVIGIIVASYIYQHYLQPKISISQQAQAWDAPTASEGIAIPVVFGTKQVKNVNVVWCGDKKVISGDSRFCYEAGLQVAICHGQVDALLDVLYADKRVLIDQSGSFG